MTNNIQKQLSTCHAVLPSIHFDKTNLKYVRTLVNNFVCKLCVCTGLRTYPAILPRHFQLVESKSNTQISLH
jgi:hypothetical protein